MPLVHRITERDELWAYAGLVVCPAAVGEVVTYFDNVILPGSVKALWAVGCGSTVHSSYSISNVVGRVGGAVVTPFVSGAVLDGAGVVLYNLIASANNVSVLVFFIVSR